MGSRGMEMGGGGDVRSAFWPQSKMCSLSLSLSPSPGFFPFPCVSSESESVCIHVDQLEGIPISTAGFFPLCGSVLCWRDGFVPSQWACQLFCFVCVCLFGVHRGNDGLKSKQMPPCAPHTHHSFIKCIRFLQIAAGHTSACSYMCLCVWPLL